MRHFWTRHDRPTGAPSREEWVGEDREPVQLPRRDVLAIILALFQLCLPLLVALIIVAAVVAMILR